VAITVVLMGVGGSACVVSLGFTSSPSELPFRIAHPVWWGWEKIDAASRPHIGRPVDEVCGEIKFAEARLWLQILAEGVGRVASYCADPPAFLTSAPRAPSGRLARPRPRYLGLTKAH
jgi:hypothetical protein